MIKTGKEHLNQLRDGRVVYIGNEKVDDVTTHPAFEKAAKKVAELYDIKHQGIYKDILSYEEDGELCSTWFLQAKDKNDLRKRTKAHKIIADQTSGMMWRSMYHVASFVTGMSTNPEIFDSGKYKFKNNLFKALVNTDCVLVY